MTAVFAIRIFFYISWWDNVNQLFGGTKLCECQPLVKKEESFIHLIESSWF